MSTSSSESFLDVVVVLFTGNDRRNVWLVNSNALLAFSSISLLASEQDDVDAVDMLANDWSSESSALFREH